MRFVPMPLAGAYVIEPEPISDKRGFFARSFCEHEFVAHGLETRPVQCNISYNTKCGTLRGMHFQRAPYGEAKLIRCTAGSIYDVIIDLRLGSPTFCQWAGYELTAKNRSALYIPQGFAHGFQTLANDSELLYQMFSFYEPCSAGGVRWDDPAFGIAWPLHDAIISDKDRAYPDYDGFSL